MAHGELTRKRMEIEIAEKKLFQKELGRIDLEMG